MLSDDNRIAMSHAPFAVRVESCPRRGQMRNLGRLESTLRQGEALPLSEDDLLREIARESTVPTLNRCHLQLQH